jgi:hypothetical protein
VINLFTTKFHPVSTVSSIDPETYVEVYNPDTYKYTRAIVHSFTIDDQTGWILNIYTEDNPDIFVYQRSRTPWLRIREVSK